MCIRLNRKDPKFNLVFVKFEPHLRVVMLTGQMGI